MLARLPLLAGLLALALAIGLGAWAVGDGIRERDRNDVISVTGSAKRRIVSDYVVWTVSVSSQRPSAAQAAEQLGGWAQRLRSFLDGGAEAGELTVQPISTETLTADNGAVTGYRLTRTFEVRSSRVQAIAALAEGSARLLQQGVPLQASPPQYVYTKLADLRPQLLAEAVKDARTRAEALVEGDLGGLRGVNVGVFQVTAPNSTEVSDYGVYDTSTLAKDVTAVVNATFGLG